MNKYGLRTNDDFAKVYKNGRNYWNRNLTIYVLKNDLDYTRVGYSVTKKIGNSVVRNKLRRRMREIVRLNFQYLKPGYDIVIIPKKSTVNIDYFELEKNMLHLFKLSKILRNKGD